ncbi:MAG TPA: four helix bundle protein [Bacteroidales bacterium]|jgi:four helix bundle protein|nr:four helix bundle protein [Bacteroidales bacterium]HNW20871.1 four helix bundle protein [Bacteroidales bacterium]HOB28018.1 four helix bundle protein [Bacteroidales bacterium]HON97941.1 four helix bundle protein [Bacteroidales bacterium]HPM40157.1 four helix bundle protein [Bacteroidales bacterium]
MKDYKYSFEKLIVWQKAREFVVFVYDIVASFPKEERYGLIDQIRRAAISVVANIAEGSSRTSKKDKAHFTQMAYSSLIEILSHFYIAYDLNYINDELFTEVKNKIYDISNLLNALYNSQIKN